MSNKLQQQVSSPEDISRLRKLDKLAEGFVKDILEDIKPEIAQTHEVIRLHLEGYLNMLHFAFEFIEECGGSITDNKLQTLRMIGHLGHFLRNAEDYIPQKEVDKLTKDTQKKLFVRMRNIAIQVMEIASEEICSVLEDI